MAVIDPDDNCLVIRVVYDGAPMAGKTTSVAALGRGFGASVYSPADYNGRTLYFDWLEYTGGVFEGRPIRCQIISVPGQTTLAPRRRRLLRSADVVVFVGDSSPAGVEADRHYLGALRRALDEVDGPPIGIVFQANKRDLADAVPLDRLHSLLDEMELRSAIVESVATEGTGIREAFVFAVRLALDRIRELMNTDSLLTARPQVNTAAELLQDISDGDVPAIPNDNVASGLVWPPVDGRIILHEMTQTTVDLRRTNDGGWHGDVGTRWSLQSAASAVFADVEAGHAELVNWARLHIANARLVSKHRCLVLASDGHGHYRLWQLVRNEPSLRTRIEAALKKDASVIAEVLLSSARTFLATVEHFAASTCDLPLTLDTVGSSASGPAFIGLLPLASATPSARGWSMARATDTLISELSFALPALRTHRKDLLAELAKRTRDPDSYSGAEWHLLQKLTALADTAM